MLWVDAEVAAVVEGVDVGAEEESVVEAVFAACGKRPDVRGLEHWADFGAGDGAAAVVGVEDDCLERVLAEALRREPGVAVDRARAVPGWARSTSTAGVPTMRCRRSRK